MQFPFLAGGGKLSDLIAAFDWSRTSLGAIEGWSPIVRSTVSLLLRSPVPIVTLWNEDGVMLYNDAYSEFAGARHPSLLGSKVREGWPEVAEFNDHVMQVCLAGETLSYKDQELTLFRRGRALQAALNLDYSPILDEDCRPIGVIAIVIETTEKVRAERWRANEQQRLQLMFEQAPGFVAMLRGPQHVFDLANPAYLELVGKSDIIGRTVREALPDVEGQGYFELLDEVYRSGKSYRGSSLPVEFKGLAGKAPERKFVDLVYQPIAGSDGVVVGIFVQGFDVSDRVQAEEALRQSEQQSRQILDSTVHSAIVAVDLDGMIVRWNEGARRMFGWDEDEVLATHWDALFTQTDRASRPREAMELALAQGIASHERWHIRKSGDHFWASGEISPLRDDDGKALGFVKVLRDRTEEYLAAEALADAEARLRRAQEVGGVGVFSLDLSTGLLSVTPEFCKTYGVDEAEVIPVAEIEKLVLSDDREVASNSRSRADGSSPLTVEYNITRAGDGQVRIISRRGEFEFDAEGRPLRLVGVVQDVTERRKAQRELQESEARFRALAQAIPNHVWTADALGQLDWFNDGVYRYAGVKPGDLDGSTWLQMVHPDDAAGAVARWQSAVSSGVTYQTEFRLRDADGHYRWHIARAVPITSENGEVTRWIGTNTDIGDLRAARETLEALNQTLEQRVEERTAERDRIWRISTDIMLIADFSARITAANPAWQTVLGWSEEDLLGRSFLDMLHPEDLETTLSEVGKLGSGATTFAFENRYRRRDGGYRIISWTAVPSDELIHAVGRDVTEERNAAANLRTTELALQQAQKMEAIGNLTGGVAHDFNNLLQVVSGNLQMLANDVTGNEKAERRISNALAGVNKGSRLASQLLAFGRRQALDPRVVNAGRLISAMDDMLRRTLGEGVEVETVVSGGLWNTLVDPIQIENALLNLAINARDAMEGYGKLTIEAGNAFIDDNYARLHQEVAPGQYVVVSVTDTGSGMTPEILDKVFDPFFSTKPEGKGTGLGLSMVYGFVKQTGGHVKIYSEVGSGTTVKLYLPRSAQAEDVADRLPDEPVVGGVETILVAEDDDAVRGTVVEMLQDLGYKVLRATDAASALTVIESGVHIDLLFTDVVMPGTLKSPELARKAKARLPDLAVLFTSGYTENSIVHGGRLDPGVQLLSKPYAREELARKIRHVLANERQKSATSRPSSAAATKIEVNTAMIDNQNQDMSKGSFRILLVEDEPLIRMGAVDMLEELGHTCGEAGRGDEAIKAFSTERFDLVMIDMGLPDMTGLALAERLRELRSDVPIVFATGEAKAPALAGGLSCYLAKPYGPREIETALTGLMN